MQQNQQQSPQQQWQGAERRQWQGDYTGEERRKAQSKESAGKSSQGTQDRKDAQQERTEQARDQTDTH